MPFVSSGGKLRYPTRAEVRHDEVELAKAILNGAHARPDQAFGEYFQGRRASCALGAAYEGIYHLPLDATGIRPQHLERLFDCLEYTLRSCPEGCKKRLSLGCDDPPPQRRPPLDSRDDRAVGGADARGPRRGEAGRPSS